MSGRCKICGNEAAPVGSVDFNKNCAGLVLDSAGIPVEYRRCPTCGFLFTEFFDAWTQAQFLERVYDEGYAAVDPEYVEDRPARMARTLRTTFAQSKGELAVLDYGGGNGALAARLRGDGFGVAQSYDPFAQPDESVLQRTYPLVTCFEVFEHHPQPVALARTLARLVDADGIVILSTLLLDGSEFERDGLDWWYVAPRNGHISIFSRAALATAWQAAGFRVASMNDDIHVAFRTIPEFARAIFAKV
jgi:2-polyprenyl-6-hydroxyphenyl methylase/3-demethylubiquinone-9 3-methyltransferase